MSKRGNRLRPCVRCRQLTRFVPWPERIAAEKKNIWHWVNEDGSHHYCGTVSPEKLHLRSIMEAE